MSHGLDPGNAVRHSSGGLISPTEAVSYTNKPFVLPFMSRSDPRASSSSKFQLIINNALDSYKKRTKNDLLSHPLAAQLQSSKSPSEILAVLQEQAQGLDRSQRSDERWTRWLDPTVNVLYTLSATLGEGVGLIFSPAKVIFAGVAVLLSAAKDVRASQDTLINIFERIEMFFRRLEIYTEVPATTEMMDIIVQIMVEVLSILGIATKEIKQGRMKKYVKKLIGRTEMKDALMKLDGLTREEARMAAAQNLKMTHNVDERMKGVANTVGDIDNKVACVDGRVAGVDDRVASVNESVAAVDDRVKVVDNNLMQVISDGKETKVSIQQMANDVEEVKRNQLRVSTHKWLSPPDPSTNHNIACGTHYKRTATWFFEDSTYQGWKSTGSLLWIHGKPGSGKSVICSTVIQDIEAMCKAGNASMAYFYLDFRDVNKRSLRDLVTSLLTQLSASSGSCCDILSDLYLAHKEGKNQPSDSLLAKCLKKMVMLPDQRPIYLIIDALDESSDTSGILSPREMVLQLLKELVDLSLPGLHICVTSRPEINIRNVLEPLTSRRVSLHDQSGQKQDITDYVRSVVYSDSQQIMRRWRTEDKELVIKTLSERADGMFRWAFCQLETLRHCLPRSVRHTLDELPESLDETYERILKEIKKPNRDHARRLLQCLVVTIRPLRVEELAEVLAVDFDDAEGIPKLNPNWRWEDEEHALLTSCSSLIAIVEANYSRVVQFSHFTVKEFLISARLATSSEVVSRYHIDFEPAHTILAQACMGVLLQADDRSSSLAEYAAQHWVTHAQFESVSLSLRKAMEYLFDLDKPYFAAWLELHNIDIRPGMDDTSLYAVAPFSTSTASPLYYAALCGFQGLVEHLVVKCPQHVNASGGYYMTPLVAALARGQFQTAKLLHHNGAHANVLGGQGFTPLHSAAYYGDLKMVQTLLDYEADVNAQSLCGCTPMHTVSIGLGPSSAVHNGTQSLPDVARLLIEHGVDVNGRADDGRTSLHAAVEYGKVEVMRVLLEHDANVDAEDQKGRTPLHKAAEYGKVEFMCMLLEHGANVGAEDAEGRTLLHKAAEDGRVEVMGVLLEHGANVGAEDAEGRTLLHKAAEDGRVEVVRVLLEHDVNVGADDKKGKTPLHAAALNGHVNLTGVLLEHGANVGAEDTEGRTPLHEAAEYGDVEVIRVLLEHGANIGAENMEGRTPLHRAAEYGNVKVTRVLLEHNATVGAKDKKGRTPLHDAALVELAGVLLEHGANVDAEDTRGRTPLHEAAESERDGIMRVLLEHGADVGAEDKKGKTPFQIASLKGFPRIMELLSDYDVKGVFSISTSSLCMPW